MLAGPQLIRVVLNPARLRVMLRELPLGDSVDSARMVEQHRPRSRRALVERQDELFHLSLLKPCAVSRRVFFALRASISSATLLELERRGPRRSLSTRYFPLQKTNPPVSRTAA